jgi:8-oxo-dGTP pyrophosphatase MutT (NUDIX family)
MIKGMAFWYKIGLLVLNEDATKFLVCEKAAGDITNLYIMPGGRMEEKTVKDCLRNEIGEELSCKVNFRTLRYIGEYNDVAAGDPDHEISIELYEGKLIGEPRPSREIKKIHWIGKEDTDNPLVSPVVRNKIIPSLIEKKILR